MLDEKKLADALIAIARVLPPRTSITKSDLIQAAADLYATTSSPAPKPRRWKMWAVNKSMGMDGVLLRNRPYSGYSPVTVTEGHDTEED